MLRECVCGCQKAYSIRGCKKAYSNWLQNSMLTYQTYLIAGDETCQCMYWRECRWSKAAVFSVVGVAQESEEFKEVRKMIQQYTCDGPEDNYVTCCGRDQKPSEDDPLIDEIGNSYLAL